MTEKQVIKVMKDSASTPRPNKAVFKAFIKRLESNEIGVYKWTKYGVDLKNPSMILTGNTILNFDVKYGDDPQEAIVTVEKKQWD